jgi:hypothetical protein
MAKLQFTAILPKKFNAKAILAEAAKEMKDIHRDVAGDFDDTVATWDNKPKFDKEFQSQPKRIRFFTGSADPIYGYVSLGTKPHRIRPKRAKALHFLGTYSAKTSPGTIKAKSGGASGAEIFSQGVQHPGTKAREFDKAIAKKWRGPFVKRLRAAVERGIKKSGHAIK